MEKVVSIIIPCYNGEKTVERCLESVLAQDYCFIETIVVDDGSTDDSYRKILSYKKRFENKGMNLIIIRQENKGLGGAINAGLAIFSGDYLCWIDCDDFLLESSIRKRLELLEKNSEIAVVTSDAFYYREADLENPIGKASDGKLDLQNPHQFENHIRSKAIFCSGCHMVRATAFLEVIPDRKIYPARRGQNWQMLLPIYYRYKQIFLDEPLYAYIIYQNSMSSGDETKEQFQRRYTEHRDIVINTLKKMDMERKERKKYTILYEGIYSRQLFYLGVSFHDYMMILNGAIKMICYNEFSKNDLKWLLSLLKKKFHFSFNK